MIDYKVKRKNIIADQIENCRKLGISVLKPSRKQLDHGMQLHQQSLVWDAYGFCAVGTGKAEINKAHAGKTG